MAVNDGDISVLLACGRDATDVWDRAEAGTGLDEHELTCPHCGATIADAQGLDRFVHRMAAQPLAPPPSVLDRVMGAVLAELRPHDTVPLDSPHGPAGISRPAVAAVLRRTVDAMGGIRARSCRIEPVPATAPPAVDVRLTVTARYGVDLGSVTARVRQMVAATAEQALGITVRRVDIEVVDVFGAVDGEGPG